MNAVERIRIYPANRTYVVRAGGAVLAESDSAIILAETGFPDRVYFPRKDIAMPFLEASETRSTCPYKGDASYFNLVAKSGTIKDAAFSYETPRDDVAEIAGFISFDDTKATVEAL